MTVVKTKSKNRNANIAAVKLLEEAYPDTFDYENVRPLKVGIQQDLLAEEKLTKTKIKRALTSYVRSINYLKSLVEGADRLDLKGQAAGRVTAEEVVHAKDKLKEIFKQRKQKQQVQVKTERINNKLQALVDKNKH